MRAVEALCAGDCGKAVRTAVSHVERMPSNGSGRHYLLCPDCGYFFILIEDAFKAVNRKEAIRFDSIGSARREYESAYSRWERWRSIHLVNDREDRDSKKWLKPDPLKLYDEWCSFLGHPDT